MASSLYQQLNPQVNVTNNYAQIFKTLQSSNNPQQALINLAKQNPEVKQTLDLLNTSNKSAKDMFYAMAKLKGVNPNDILNMLK